MKPIADLISAGVSRSRRFGRHAYLITAISLAMFPGLMFGQAYVQTNLVSDGFVPAATTDPNLKNPWGLVQGPTPFWISDQVTGVSTLYKPTGAKVPLTVTINAVTPPPPPNGPTGVVFNGGAGFVVTSTAQTAPSLFLFANLNGNVYGWNGSTMTTTNTIADVGATVNGGVLTGLAINAAKSDIFVANFTPTGGVMEFNSSFAPVATTFSDPTLPAGYEPYNVVDINNNLFVANEPMNAMGLPLQGVGNGVIDEFNDSTGALEQTLISGGQLDDPWGMAVAPASFGAFGGDLLVGNFGNGEINAFNAATGAFEGTLDLPDGSALTNDGLWSLFFGTGGAGSDPNTLYITAGLNGQKDGVFAKIDPTPEPATLLLFAAGLFLLGFVVHRRRTARE